GGLRGGGEYSLGGCLGASARGPRSRSRGRARLRRLFAGGFPPPLRLPFSFDYNIVVAGFFRVKPYKKLLFFVLVALAAAAILTPWVFSLWNSFVQARRHRAEFEQIFAGVFIFSGVALLLASPSLLRPRLLRGAGLGEKDQGDFFSGFVLAVASMALLAVVMYVAGALTPGLSDPVYA